MFFCYSQVLCKQKDIRGWFWAIWLNTRTHRLSSQHTGMVFKTFLSKHILVGFPPWCEYDNRSCVWPKKSAPFRDPLEKEEPLNWFKRNPRVVFGGDNVIKPQSNPTTWCTLQVQLDAFL